MPQKAVLYLYLTNAVKLDADQENTKPKLILLEMMF